MRGKFCQDCGWSPSGKTDAGSVTVTKQTLDKGSAAITAGGDISGVSIVSSGGITKPAVERMTHQRLFKRWWLNVLSVLGLAGSVASITGVKIGDLQIPGLWTTATGPGGLRRILSTTSPTPPLTPTPSPSTFPQIISAIGHSTWMRFYVNLVALMVLIMLTGSIFGTLSSLKHRSYIRLWWGRILETGKDKRLYISKLQGTCPECGSPLRLRKIRVDERVTRDSEGKEHRKAIKEPRLVCIRNGEHEFKFDPTKLVEESAARRPE